MVQERSPLKEDWILSVKKDLETFQLDHLTFPEIKKMKKYKLKKIVKKALKKKAFEYLQVEKNRKNKIKNIQYSTLELQQYLKTDKIGLRRKKLLFKTRTRMLQVGHNYGKKQSCPVCLSPCLDKGLYLNDVLKKEPRGGTSKR